MLPAHSLSQKTRNIFAPSVSSGASATMPVVPVVPVPVAAPQPEPVSLPPQSSAVTQTDPIFARIETALEPPIEATTAAVGNVLNSVVENVAGIVPPVDLQSPISQSESASPINPTEGPTDLDLLEQAIAEAEQMVPQAVPTAMLQVVADAEAAQAAQGAARSGGKETVGGMVAAPETPDGGAAPAAVESGQNVQYVEYEPNPELPPEVEGFLNKVEQHGDQAPAEVVIAGINQAFPVAHQLPSQPVVVLPITPDVEAEGVKKSPKFSIRWLVEWSHKIMKMFVGKVVYRQAAA